MMLGTRVEYGRTRDGRSYDTPNPPETSPPELPMPIEVPRATTTDPDETLESAIPHEQ